MEQHSSDLPWRDRDFGSSSCRRRGDKKMAERSRTSLKGWRYDRHYFEFANVAIARNSQVSKPHALANQLGYAEWAGSQNDSARARLALEHDPAWSFLCACDENGKLQEARDPQRRTVAGQDTWPESAGDFRTMSAFTRTQASVSEWRKHAQVNK